MISVKRERASGASSPPAERAVKRSATARCEGMPAPTRTLAGSVSVYISGHYSAMLQRHVDNKAFSLALPSTGDLGSASFAAEVVRLRPISELSRVQLRKLRCSSDLPPG